MRTIGLAVSIYLGLVSIGPAQDRTITIATEGAFPPWNAVDTNGAPIGFDIDVGKALCDVAKLRCTFVTQAWDGIIPALSVGKFDAIMAGMSITEKRKQVIGFSDPYALTSNYFVVSKDLGLPPTDSDAKLDLSQAGTSNALLRVLRENLSGRTIGVQGSTNAEAFVRDYLGDDVTIRTYDKQDNLNLDLVSGRIDGGLADYSVWKTFLESADGQKAALYGPRISGGLFGPGIGIGLRKDDKELATLFNAALQELRRTGQLKALSEKWFDADLVSN
ncbi:amino acid ABC transporter substrate-binding protein (PAAT family) [Rhizobium sp. PP-F2F-G48]|uniref:transporter substrate-binding domain-containing protein n=1 Tax=Rhizobium sp. PP-F2F-G48 TaxID=2135651 RepID=UPI001044C966|nr:transporter substrate-binding domain-containing protein [Rhizobium sp. PP-F2F-G48]TCM50671.1 amino acid ABC transporter substrate-binding protein (PAAT family) [Rhizobium sp. PP-F2F-G48]